MKVLLFLVALSFAAYWFVFRDGCGTRGALECPDSALEEGVGTAVEAKEACDDAGYLCTGRNGPFQVMRWQLDKGRLRVRVSLPEFLDAKTAEEVREAAVDGIMEWDRHPLPIVIDSGKYTVRFWDIGVVWTQGLFNEAAGLARQRGSPDGKRLVFENDGLAVVVPPIVSGESLETIAASSDPQAVLAQVRGLAAGGQPMGPAFLARVRAV